MKFSTAFIAAASLYLIPFINAQDDTTEATEAPVPAVEEDLAEKAGISRPQFSVCLISTRSKFRGNCY